MAANFEKVFGAYAQLFSDAEANFCAFLFHLGICVIFTLKNYCSLVYSAKCGGWYPLKKKWPMQSVGLVFLKVRKWCFNFGHLPVTIYRPFHISICQCFYISINLCLAVQLSNYQVASSTICLGMPGLCIFSSHIRGRSNEYSIDHWSVRTNTCLSIHLYFSVFIHIPCQVLVIYICPSIFAVYANLCILSCL